MTTPLPASSPRLMVSSALRPQGAPAPIEARRGMSALDAAGQPAGTVAGILIDDLTGSATHILVVLDMVAGDYRLVPVAQVARLDVETIHLLLPAADLTHLPRHKQD